MRCPGDQILILHGDFVGTICFLFEGYTVICDHIHVYVMHMIQLVTHKYLDHFILESTEMLIVSHLRTLKTYFFTCLFLG